MSDRINVSQFKGIKNDTNSKQVGIEYFADIVNFNFNETSVMGLSKTLCPKREIQIDTEQIDGIYEYRFLDNSNILKKEIIVVCGGNIYKTDITSTKTLIYSGISKGKCSFATYQDKLFIANGKDNVLVYYGSYGIFSQMGAPLALVGHNNGFLTGSYKYQLTYITNGGEEIVGSISNTITVNQQSIKVSIPLGYEGTNKRKLYRTKNNGDTFYFVREIADNTTLEIDDNLIDDLLGDKVGVVNNELPKPRFLSVAGNRLYGGSVDKYPTQLFSTDVFTELFDSASYIDVSNFGNDNTPITAVSEDFNKIVVGTQKNIFFVNPQDNSVVLTRANIGILDGYSVAKCPSFNNFAGGLMFVSTEYDIRLMSGLQALPVATSLDNISTVNYAQNIQGTLPNDIKGYSNIASIFFNYKFMLQVDTIRYVFDIRNSAWTKQNIKTQTYESFPIVLAQINGQLVNGQKDGYLETEYVDIKYRNEDVRANLESVEINAQTIFTFVEKFYFWLSHTENNDLTIEVVSDSNVNHKQEKQFKVLDGAFSSDFVETDFTRCKKGLDYKVYNIYKPCRWLKYKLTINSGSTSLENFEISGQKISNKE